MKEKIKDFWEKAGENERIGKIGDFYFNKTTPFSLDRGSPLPPKKLKHEKHETNEKDN